MSATLPVGVIGHVDHGKTSLVKALTGVDTDRLPEERARGMSIVLGFAHLELRDGVVDLIDVPGHEDFIRAMIAGATGMAGTVLAIDVAEDIRPQTREHLAIASLVGVRAGVVALTKCDRVDDEAQARVCDNAVALVRQAGWTDAPVAKTSAQAGVGLDTLRESLGAMLRDAPLAADAVAPQLPIDRVFSMSGRGTVLTGTLRAGRIAAGDTLEIAPSGRRVIVRELQVHGRRVDEAHAGQRVGVNLRGVPAQAVQRGEVLTAPDAARAGSLLDCELRALPGSPLVHGSTVRLHAGTAQCVARLRLLDGDTVAAGASRYAQLVCDRVLCAGAGEPFVVRRLDGRATLGGGRILGVAPRRRLRGATAADALLAAASGAVEHRALARLRDAGLDGVDAAALAIECGVTPERLLGALGARSACTRERRLVHRRAVDEACRRFLAALDAHHERHPLRDGATVSQARAMFPDATRADVAACCLDLLAAEGRIERSGDVVRRPGFDPMARLGPDERHAAASMEARYRAGGAMPPDLAASTAAVGSPVDPDALWRLLVARGVLVRVAGGGDRPLLFHRDAVTTIKATLRNAYPPPAAFTVSEAKQVLGSTRKYVVPLLEFLDGARFTRRSGDRRVVLSNGGE